MHKIKVLTFGSKNFNTSLEELKEYLNFELVLNDNHIKDKQLEKYTVLLAHEDFFLSGLNQVELIQNVNSIKILASKKDKKYYDFFDDKIFLPFTVNELNKKIENSVIKKNFNKNSFIKIKEYILNKNEKKLSKDSDYVLLTEKEIQLLELFLDKVEPSSKNEILEKVWKYASDADTHTVETHIYRLRKKIKSKFSDENFILNDKLGYLI